MAARQYSRASSRKVGKAMHERKKGTLRSGSGPHWLDCQADAPRTNLVVDGCDNRRPTGGKRGASLSFRSIMDQGKVLLVNLAKGKIGEDSSSLLGGLIVTSLGLAAFSRADMDEQKRRPFYIFIDEFQNFTTLALANMLSELRKYRIGVVLAHQYLTQLDQDIREAVLGNVGTMIAFRVSALDAQYISREFAPFIQPLDLLNLPNHEAYVRLMIDGAPSKPFSAKTLHTYI